MKAIDFNSFLLRQPNFPDEMSTDRYFYDLANRLVEETRCAGLLNEWHQSVVCRAALCLTGYFQDILADAGVWRSFINQHRNLYNRTLPFFEVTDEYIDYELNREDVRFLMWYALAMNCEDRRDLSPLDPDVLAAADKWFEIFESIYEEAPVPEGYRIAHEIEMHAEEDSEQVMRLARWVAHHCYLMTPADSLSLSNLYASDDFSEPDGEKRLRTQVDKMLTESPIGPLALFLREWMYLITENRLPRQRVHESAEPHKYFLPFMAANNNEPMKIFGSYSEMNDFLINALGWAPGVEHLSQLKNSHNFILMVNRNKGMLVAVDIAECVKSPGNELYNEDIAKKYAFSLLTVRGMCPGDLLIYLCRNNWLPDAAFPTMPETSEMVQENWDFIARCYLQNYYRED